MYVFNKETYERAWNLLQNIYNITHSAVVLYLNETWIQLYKHKFVKFYTNQISHFGNNFTLRGEEGHAMLKSSLSFSINDLKKVVDCIELLLLNQRNDYVIILEKAKMRLATDLWLSILRDLYAQITFFALRRILSQWQLIAAHSTALPRCINTFTTCMRLSYAHCIQAWMYSELSHILKMEDVHGY